MVVNYNFYLKLIILLIIMLFKFSTKVVDFIIFYIIFILKNNKIILDYIKR